MPVVLACTFRPTFPLDDGVRWTFGVARAD